MYMLSPDAGTRARGQSSAQRQRTPSMAFMDAAWLSVIDYEACKQACVRTVFESNRIGTVWVIVASTPATAAAMLSACTGPRQAPNPHYRHMARSPARGHTKSHEIRRGHAGLHEVVRVRTSSRMHARYRATFTQRHFYTFTQRQGARKYASD
eukprot:5453338-Pleurochrysis_carterae.AAC.1